MPESLKSATQLGTRVKQGVACQLKKIRRHAKRPERREESGAKCGRRSRQSSGIRGDKKTCPLKMLCLKFGGSGVVKRAGPFSLGGTCSFWDACNPTSPGLLPLATLSSPWDERVCFVGLLPLLPWGGEGRGEVGSYSPATSFRLPSSSTSRPVSRARSITLGCHETLPASGPPTMASINASSSPEIQRKPR
jgi:hypothetical protein